VVPDSQGGPGVPPAGSDPSAEAELLEAIQSELRALASSLLRGERRGPTLQTTALVNEAWLRLSGQGGLGSASREAYLALAARAIRRILVDRARRRSALKRGGGNARVDLEEDALAGEERVDHLALDEALVKLARLDERQARIVELRFFAGLEVDEVARVLGVSARTVAGDWAMAKAFLHAELEPGGNA
jgi:RNA polymerase sigma factor (TIGR02999 family)